MTTKTLPKESASFNGGIFKIKIVYSYIMDLVRTTDLQDVLGALHKFKTYSF